MLDIMKDTLTDAAGLLPFLFFSYLAMEYIEHRMGEKAKNSIKRAGRFGPAIGGLLGAFPQCGFAAAASDLYAGRVITLGTLLAVLLSASDEMLPILVSERANAAVIFKLLCMKAAAGIAAGFLADLLIGRRIEAESGRGGEGGHAETGRICCHGNCRRGGGIVKSAFGHTLQIFLFILFITFVLNGIINYAGEEFLAGLMTDRPVVSHMIAGLIGLIPNCASSVVITQLYLKGVAGLGTAMSGLLAGSGIGLAVLYRANGSGKENARITLLLYGIGVATGILTDFLGIRV